MCIAYYDGWAGESKIQKPKEAKIIKQGAGMAEDGKF